MSEHTLVPCNGCGACCKQHRVPLTAQEAASGTYSQVPNRRSALPLVGYMLTHKWDGTCVYLSQSDSDGKLHCTIWERAPQACKQFDCREWFTRFTRDEQDIVLGDGLDSPTAVAAMERMP